MLNVKCRCVHMCIHFSNLIHVLTQHKWRNNYLYFVYICDNCSYFICICDNCLYFGSMRVITCAVLALVLLCIVADAQLRRRGGGNQRGANSVRGNRRGVNAANRNSLNRRGALNNQQRRQNVSFHLFCTITFVVTSCVHCRYNRCNAN